MITRDEFVKNIKVQTSDSAVRSVLSALNSPPGRVPNDSDVGLTRWFTSLSDRDRAAVSEVIREAAEHAIFGLFAILDGERVFEYSADKGDLELYYVKGKQRILLNPPNADELHNVYNRLCQEDHVVEGRKPNRRGPRSKATR